MHEGESELNMIILLCNTSFIHLLVVHVLFVVHPKVDRNTMDNFSLIVHLLIVRGLDKQQQATDLDLPTQLWMLPQTVDSGLYQKTQTW